MNLREHPEHKFSLGQCLCPNCFKELSNPIDNELIQHARCSACCSEFYYQSSNHGLFGYFSLDGQYVDYRHYKPLDEMSNREKLAL